MKRAAALLLAIPAGGCENNQLAVAGSSFDPIDFFSGHSGGAATLHTITGSSHAISVDSHGRPDGRGGLVLDQRVDEQGKPARTRRWVLRPAGPNRWMGTLTDSAGPVTVERTPSEVIIRYRMHSGANVQQHLALLAPGVALNHMIISRFGLRLATLNERIRKLD